MKNKIKIILISVIVIVVVIIGALFIKSNREFYKDIQAVKNDEKPMNAKLDKYASHNYGFGYTIRVSYDFVYGDIYEFYYKHKLIYRYQEHDSYKEGFIY